jgi:alpha-tubulin suppressor-like RCC1 family protein
VGTYSDCTIKVTDPSSNVSNTLTISSFLIHYKAVAVTEGNNHACALLDNGSMQCWGYAANYRLGNGSTTSQSSPVNVSNIDNATAIAAGLHTCALLSGGTIKCWGSGSYGKLGNGSTNDNSTPVSVSNISNATSISAGSSHSCAVLDNGTVMCWGAGDSGQLGNGSTSHSNTPVAVSNIDNATAVTVSGGWSCALLDNGTVQCWGAGAMLGYGSTSDNSTPVSVSNITTATGISTGPGSYTCAVLSGGTVKCWGEDSGDYGVLGNGSTSRQLTPVSVNNISNATAISVGQYSACALLSGGTVKCWGRGSYGQLGNGSTSDTLTPVSVSNISTATALSNRGGSQFHCALLSGGAIQCWGTDDEGKLGDGGTVPNGNTTNSEPVYVVGFGQ